MTFSSRHNKFNCGFTLLELLLALALTSLLVLLTLSIVIEQVEFQMSRAEQIPESRRAVGIMNDLRTDLSLIVVTRSKKHTDTDMDRTQSRSVLNSQLSNETRIRSELDLNIQDVGERPVALFGTSNWMVITLIHGNERVRGGSSVECAMQSILWTGCLMNDTRVPVASRNGRLRYRSLRNSQPGLLRLECSERNDRLDVMEASARSVEFRYSDGIQWLAEWDSTQRSTLPNAVKIEWIDITGEHRSVVSAVSAETADRTDSQPSIAKVDR